MLLYAPLRKCEMKKKSWQSDLFIFCGVSTQLLLGTLAKLRKAAISFVMPLCLSVRPSAWNISAITWLIFIKFGTWGFLESLSWKLFSLNWDQNNRYLTWTLRAFMILSRWILLRMRNISDKLCKGNQSTHFMFHNLFPKIMSFLKYCGKIWYGQKGHRWPYNVAKKRSDLRDGLLGRYYIHSLIIFLR